jgi:hypothetical protein
MGDMDDYLARKRDQLGLDRGDQLSDIQEVLDTWYPGRVRAKSLNDGVLQIVTPSSAIAGELRLRQVELLGVLDRVESLRITIE